MIIDVKYTTVAQVPAMPRIRENERTDYGLRRDGTEYGVYGMMFIQNRVDYLACRTEDLPRFLPSWLFDVRVSSLPSGWKICNVVYDKGYFPLYEKFGVSCLVGYEELVTNPIHYEGIIDLEEDDLRKFFRIKNQIDLELYGRVI